MHPHACSGTAALQQTTCNKRDALCEHCADPLVAGHFGAAGQGVPPRAAAHRTRYYTLAVPPHASCALKRPTRFEHHEQTSSPTD